jgi:hypothetical protein
VGLQFALEAIFERESLSRQQGHFIHRTQTEGILPAWDEPGQLTETTGAAEGVRCSYFQLPDPVTTYSHENGDLAVIKRPASKRGSQRLLGLVCQDGQYTLGQIAFIHCVGLDFSAEKSLKKRAGRFQISMDFHFYAFFASLAG